MRQYLAGKIRNIALAGHAGSGKTSLAEALLFKVGEIDRLGTIADGNTALDHDPEEIKRQSSLGLSTYPFTWGSVKINMLDTPGLFDFAGGMYEGIRAAENVIITVSARSGVTVGAKKAYQEAVKRGKGRLFFINKMDIERADFYKVLEEMKANFGPSVCPIVVPYVKDRKVESYINLVDQKAYKYNEKGEATEVPMPEMEHRIEGLTNAISEAVAESDETLFEKYFSGEPFTRDEILSGIHKGVKSGTIAPVLCGSAISLEGVDMLLDSIVDHLPSAWDSAGEVATNEKGELVEIACNDDAPLGAFVFKTVADPFVGKLSFVKVVSGKLSGESTPVNSRTNEPERMGKLVYIKGKKQEDTSFITAGDIGAVVKMTGVQTGDSLCDASRVVSFEKTVYPNPTYSMAVVVTKKGEEGKVANGMNRLMEEDQTLEYGHSGETGQMVLTGLGEQHLDSAVSKLKTKFGADVTLEPTRVAYRETIRKTVKAEGKHKKQTGGHGQFGHVWIEFAPHDGEELIFETNVFGGSVPKNYFPAVQKGLEDAIEKGVLAGYPVVGLKATLYDGSYHAVDSSEMAFKMAASLAYREGISKASPVLLEPIGKLKVAAPDSATGDVMSEFNKRRGRVLGMHPTEDGLQEVEGEVPMSEMADFTTALRALTQGEGSFTLKFERYEPVPPNMEEKIIKEAKELAKDN